MKLTVDFSALWNIASKIGAEKSTFSLNDEIREIDPIDVSLSGKGIEVDPEDLQLKGGLFSYEGRQVVLYIPNHTNREIEKALTTKSVRKKFHVTFCRHLEDMKRKKQFEKYKATNNLSGLFNIFGKSKIDRTLKDGNVELDVCMYCLQKLNYKGSSDRNICRTVRDTFDIPEFFSTYSSFFPYLPSGIGGDPSKADYSPDWKRKSAEYRASKNYTCENCHVNLNSHKSLLHTHHIDTIPGHDQYDNLQALCIDCHRKEHSHMHVSYNDMQTVTRLRREQGLIQRQWDSVLNLADPALYGSLRKLQSEGYMPPEIGYSITGNSDQASLAADAAWPETKLAIMIETAVQNVDGWNIVPPENFL